MEKGYLAIVLHAHLPFVRHPEHSDFLEEDWFFEALTETYIPLLQMMDGLERDGVDFRLTLSLSPTLLSMMIDPLLQERYLKKLEKLIELSAREIERTAAAAGCFKGWPGTITICSARPGSTSRTPTAAIWCRLLTVFRNADAWR